MELKYIKEKICSVCGAITESESKKHQHSNSRWNEERTFTCGRTIHYYPNFSEKDAASIAILSPCSNSKEIIERDRLRRKLVRTLKNIIDESEVDDDYKIKLYRIIPGE